MKIPRLKKEQTTMKNKMIIRIKWVFALALILAAAGCFTACAQWKTPYKTLDKDGYTVSVRFDANGGSFANSPEDVYVIDVFNINSMKQDADGNRVTPLIAPDNPSREDKAFGISKNGYFFAGWYSSREARVDENGNALDEFGIPTSQSGREQGYIYSGLWDFENDLLKVDPSKEYSSEESVMTLYAAWIPYVNYEIYAPGADGQFEKLESVSAIELVLPQWNEKTGKLDMKRFPEIDGKTLDKVYLDEQMTEMAPATVKGDVDYENGTTLTQTVKLYTTWLDGDWYRISNANQLYKIADLDGHYLISADLDFENEVWPSAFSGGAFKGGFYSADGNKYKISNVSVVQGNISTQNGGLFATLESGATFENIEFENVTYTLKTGSRKPDASFGLLAGKAASDVILDGVSVSGKIVVSDDCYANNNYVVGLLFGTGYNGQIDISSIDCEVDGDETKITVDVDRESGSVTLTFAELSGT